MENELALMQAALAAQGYNYQLHQETARIENLDVLRANFGDWPLQKFFQTYSFDEGVELGLVWYDQVNCFKKEHDWNEHFTACVKAKLLPVGNGANGDPIVVDAIDLAVGFLYHDKLWEQEISDPRACLVKLDCFIGRFYYNAVTQEEYPIDAYGAQEYMSVRQ